MFASFGQETLQLSAPRRPPARLRTTRSHTYISSFTNRSSLPAKCFFFLCVWDKFVINGKRAQQLCSRRDPDTAYIPNASEMWRAGRISGAYLLSRSRPTSHQTYRRVLRNILKKIERVEVVRASWELRMTARMVSSMCELYPTYKVKCTKSKEETCDMCRGRGCEFHIKLYYIQIHMFTMSSFERLYKFEKFKLQFQTRFF